MSNSNGYKAQYKGSSNQSWQTKTSGSEQGCFEAAQRLRNDYPFVRVVDSDGRVVG